jgi:hypothetical protein
MKMNRNPAFLPSSKTSVVAVLLASAVLVGSSHASTITLGETRLKGRRAGRSTDLHRNYAKVASASYTIARRRSPRPRSSMIGWWTSTASGCRKWRPIAAPSFAAPRGTNTKLHLALEASTTAAPSPRASRLMASLSASIAPFWTSSTGWPSATRSTDRPSDRGLAGRPRHLAGRTATSVDHIRAVVPREDPDADPS